MTDDDATVDSWEPDALDPAESARAEAVQRFWEAARGRAGVGRLAYVTGLSPSAAVPPPVAALAEDPAIADRRADLVTEGTLTATSSLLAEVEGDPDGMPARGDLWLVVDGGGRPRALVRTTDVSVATVETVPDEHRAAETGSGAQDWDGEVRPELATAASRLGEVLAPSTALVLERFEVLYP